MTIGISRRPGARGHLGLLAGCLALALGSAPAAKAGDFYLGGGLSMSWAIAEASGANFIGNTNLGPSTGSDTDSSPAVTGVVGFEFPLQQVLPRRLPRWMPDLDLRDWAIRTEIEAAGAREYDYDIQKGMSPHRAELSHWSVGVNGWLDLPLGHALEAIFGRLRWAEPIVFSPGAGVGFGRTTVTSTDNVISISDETHNGLNWQVGAELGYPLGDRVSLTGGYRYVRIGSVDNALTDINATQPLGNLGLDVDAHEMHLGFRVRFWSIRFPRGLFGSGRDRYQP